MKYTVKPTSLFKKDLKKMQKQHKDLELLNQILKLLADGKALPEKNRDHALTGNYTGCRECHIQPDWLLTRCSCTSPVPAATANSLTNNHRQTAKSGLSFLFFRHILRHHDRPRHMPAVRCNTVNEIFGCIE